MTEMDTVAHQNSAACEQTSVSAEELKLHAGKLSAMVRQLENVIHGVQKTKVRSVETQVKPLTPAEDVWDEVA